MVLLRVLIHRKIECLVNSCPSRMGHRYLLVLVCWIWAINPATSQVQVTMDTIQSISKLIQEQRIEKALVLSEKWLIHHPRDLSMIRQHLKLQYWSGNLSGSEKEYERYTQLYPLENELKLDFARFLVETGKLNKGRKILEEYLLQDTVNLESKYLLGMVYYWQGEVVPAKILFKKVIAKDSSNAKATTYLNEIESLLAPQLYFQSGYYSDQQPIKKVVTGLEAKVYRSQWLYPFFRVQNQTILDHNNLWWFEAGNSIKLIRTGAKAEMNLGVVRYPDALHSVDWTGGFSLSQPIYKTFSAAVGVAKKPYFYTFNSLAQPISLSEWAADISWGKSFDAYTVGSVRFLKLDHWNIKIGGSYLQFNDKNTQENLFGWVLSPPVSFSKLNFRLGYAYSYANTDGLRYSSSLSISEGLSNLMANKQIPGIYNPYFTPLDQQIHSLMAQISLAPTKNWLVQLKGNYGIYASAKAPYVYLDKNEAGDLYYATGSAIQSYTPFEINVLTSYKFSKRATLDLGYTFQRAFFFDSQYLKIGIKYAFQ